MKLAIMQPYFFPYLGYFQLMHAVDKFVFLDDVNFINRGWINRNRLRFGPADRYFTVPLAGASQNRLIKDIHVLSGETRWKRKMLDSFRTAYRGTPFLAPGLDLIERALSVTPDTIANVARESVLLVMDYLGLRREIVATAEVYANSTLKGQDRIVDICRREKATIYINAAGGRALYQDEPFLRAGIELQFIESRRSEYPAGVTDLSILDLIMRWPANRIVALLGQYDLRSTDELVAPVSDNIRGDDGRA